MILSRLHSPVCFYYLVLGLAACGRAFFRSSDQFAYYRGHDRHLSARPATTVGRSITFRCQRYPTGIALVTFLALGSRITFRTRVSFVATVAFISTNTR